MATRFEIYTDAVKFLQAAFDEADQAEAALKDIELDKVIESCTGPYRLNLRQAIAHLEGLVKDVKSLECDECGHALAKHGDRYGCEYDRGDGYRGNSDVLEALGPCGCKWGLEDPKKSKEVA